MTAGQSCFHCYSRPCCSHTHTYRNTHTHSETHTHTHTFEAASLAENQTKQQQRWRRTLSPLEGGDGLTGWERVELTFFFTHHRREADEYARRGVAHPHPQPPSITAARGWRRDLTPTGDWITKCKQSSGLFFSIKNIIRRTDQRYFN